MPERYMDRRHFLGFAAATTAAIGMRFALGTPEVESSEFTQPKLLINDYHIPLNAHDFGDFRDKLTQASQIQVPIREGNIRYKPHLGFYLWHDPTGEPSDPVTLEEFLNDVQADGAIPLLDCKDSVVDYKALLKQVTDRYAARSPIWVCSQDTQTIDPFREDPNYTAIDTIWNPEVLNKYKSKRPEKAHIAVNHQLLFRDPQVTIMDYDTLNFFVDREISFLTWTIKRQNAHIVGLLEPYFRHQTSAGTPLGGITADFPEDFIATCKAA